jgi:fumarate reductase subunit C
MLRKIFAISWIWGVLTLVNLGLAVNSFVDFRKDMLIFNLLCAALCCLAWISSRIQEVL